MNTGKRAVFYARVSTQEEAQLKALPQQVRECEDAIKAQGWVLVDRYVDEGKSGTQAISRKEYQRLYDDMELDKFDIIVVKSQDRLQRNTKDWYIFVDRLVVYDKKLYFYLDNNFYTPDNALITGIKAILAEEYSKELSKKLRNANNKRVERAKAGEKFVIKGNNNIFGFHIEGGECVIDEKEAELVRLMYNLYLEHDSLRAVTDAINTRGYRNRKGNLFSAAVISKILQNERNKGTVILNRYHKNFYTKKVETAPEDEWVIIENAHDAIVDNETWENVNQKLAEKRSDRRGVKPCRNPLGHKLYCASCGAYLLRSNSGGSTSWQCSNNRLYGKSSCEAPVTISNKTVRDILRNLTGSLEVNRDVVKEYCLTVLKMAQERLISENSITDTHKELNRLQGKLERLREVYIDGLYTKEEYIKRKNEVQAAIDECEKKLLPIEENEDIKDIERVLSDLDTELDKWIASEEFEENKIDFIIEHTEKIIVTKDKHLIFEMDMIGGVIVAGEDFISCFCSQYSRIRR